MTSLAAYLTRRNRRDSKRLLRYRRRETATKRRLLIKARREAERRGLRGPVHVCVDRWGWQAFMTDTGELLREFNAL